MTKITGSFSSVETRQKGLRSTSFEYLYDKCLIKSNIFNNFQASTTLNLRFINLWLCYSVELRFDTQIWRQHFPPHLPRRPKILHDVESHQVFNRISLCSELRYSLHVYRRISSLPTRTEEMETQVPVGYYDKAFYIC
jgi:hypothetical protein